MFLHIQYIELLLNIYFPFYHSHLDTVASVLAFGFPNLTLPHSLVWSTLVTWDQVASVALNTCSHTHAFVLPQCVSPYGCQLSAVKLDQPPSTDVMANRKCGEALRHTRCRRTIKRLEEPHLVAVLLIKLMLFAYLWQEKKIGLCIQWSLQQVLN